jgi:hypothetical protein
VKRFAGYAGVVLGWSLLVFAVFLAGVLVDAVLFESRDVIAWRVALGALIAIGAALGSLFVVRWARSAVGRPDGFRLGRIMFGITLFTLGTITAMSPQNQGATQTDRNAARAIGVPWVLLGAILIIEAGWWHRATKAIDPLPTAPGATPHSDAQPGIALPEPPPSP